MLARTGGPGGLLGAFGTKNLKKRRKTGPFWLFLERLGTHFGAHVGSKRPSWLHLGRLGLDFLSLWVDLGSIFWLLVAWAALQKTLQKLLDYGSLVPKHELGGSYIG